MGPNKPASERWDQGFSVRVRDGVEMIVFERRETAERIAARGKFLSDVVPLEDGTYALVRKP